MISLFETNAENYLLKNVRQHNNTLLYRITRLVGELDSISREVKFVHDIFQIALINRQKLKLCGSPETAKIEKNRKISLSKFSSVHNHLILVFLTLFLCNDDVRARGLVRDWPLISRATNQRHTCIWYKTRGSTRWFILDDHV